MTDLTFNIVALGDAFTKMISLGDSVERLSIKLDELSRKVATPRVDVDTTAANVKLDELNHKLNSTQGLSGATNNVQTALIGLGAALSAGALSGGALLAIPAGIAAIGIAAVHTNADVRTSFTDLTSTARTSLTQGFAPFVPALVAIAAQGKAAFAGLTPVFAQAAAATAPLLVSVSSGLIKATTAGVGATVPLLQGLGPVAQAIGDDFGKVERGVAGLLGNLDVSGAANGLSILGTDVEQLLPAVGSLIAEVTPLANALLSDLGPALTNAAHDLLILTPILNAAGAVISFLGPDISTLGPPLLAVMGITKLMTGSWLDFGGAVGKVKPLFADFGGTLDSIGQKLGYTSKATNEARSAEAASVLTKAELTKASREQAVAEAEQAYAADASTKNALALNAAQDELAVSSAAASAAEAELATTSEAATFSFGPLGIALAGIGLLLAPFILGNHDATTSTQDLTTSLVQLSQANPGARAGILSSNQALSDLVNKAGVAKVNVQDLISAYDSGPQALQSFTDKLDKQHGALGSTTIGLRQAGDAYTEASGNAAQTFQTIEQLTNSVNKHDISLSSLPTRIRGLVNEYNAQKDMQSQLGTSVQELTSQQNAHKAVTSASIDTVTRAATVADVLGLSLDGVVTAYQNMTAGTNYAMTATAQMTDTLLTQELAVGTANSTVTNYFKQADQAAAQASQSLVDSNHSYQQSITAVGDAQHAAAQADKAVATARAGVVTAERGVTDALANEVTAENSVTKAQVARTQAQVNLNTATQQAVEQLKALHLQMADQVTSEESAQLALFDQLATSNALGVTPDNAAALAATPADQITTANEAKIKAAIDLLKAEQALNNTLNTGANLRSQVAAADAAGVSGSAGVIAAQNALASAQDQVVSAQQAYVKSQQAVSDAQANVLKAEQGVKDSLYNEQKARAAVSDSLYNEKKAMDAVGTAQAALTVAQDNASRSMDISTAAGQRNLAMLQKISEQLYANEGPQQAGNDLITNTATLFGITTQKAQDYLTKLGLIPPDFQFSITGVAGADLSALNNAYAKMTASGRNATPGLPVPHAAGGMIRGPGTGTSDSIPAMTHDGSPLLVSNGEFIVNARDTRKNLALLEIINSGRAFASGGHVTPADQALTLSTVGDYYQTGVDVLGALGFPAPASLPKYVPPAVTAGPGGGSLAASGATAAAAQAYALSQLGVYGWGPDQMPPLIKLWNQESGWNPNAVNPSSGAYGIPQSLGHGHPYNLGDYVGQINWGLPYIKGRYGSPGAAWAHEVADNWYRNGGLIDALRAPKVRDNGGPIDPGWNMIYNGTGRPENSRSGAQEDALLGELKALRLAMEKRPAVQFGDIHGGPSADVVVHEVMRRLQFSGRR